MKLCFTYTDDVLAEIEELIAKVEKLQKNQVLINKMYALNTVDDVNRFVESYKNRDDKKSGPAPGTLLQSQMDLIQLYEDHGFKGYVMNDGYETTFQSSLKKELCEQFLTTSLTRDLFKVPYQDYTEVSCTFTNNRGSTLVVRS